MNTNIKNLFTSLAVLLIIGGMLIGLTTVGVMLAMKSAETGDLVFLAGAGLAHLIALSTAGVLGSCFKR